ncbi:TetR/AcrR family transcriptional regulator [Cryptosporangium arvum]|uniref:TetR/AcrR family transcriptional regulator n=1 Tax=Cryptosporangium arvum TaxID=80871 RepID=UPI0004BCB8D8|nr:TetR/AcrR family transcriptional regulator [Cryptosporangium arvum]
MPTAKKPRTDALRNRDTILRAARTAFAAADGPVALEHIARDAGVGIGTLYRHFPTRDDLVEAVYAAELDEVADSATTLLRDLPPDAALRAWLQRYAAFVATKRGLAETLRAALTTGRIAQPVTRRRITAAVAAILARGGETGTLRTDVDPEDVVVLALGAFATGPGDPGRTERLIALVLDAVRVRS